MKAKSAPTAGPPTAPPPAQGVRLPGWRLALAELGLGPQVAASHREGIENYLEYCRRLGTEATVESARHFMEQAEKEGELGSDAVAGWKAALNWFFRAARHQLDAAGRQVPPPAQQDLGKTDWERRLIQQLRTLHLSWRTEQTYRGWVWRWARFLAPRSVEESGGTEAGEFLTWLATYQRVSAATQRQALNALVFFLREVVGHEAVELERFTPARRSHQVPVVLSRAECHRLYDALTGTTRLMAQLIIHAFYPAPTARISRFWRRNSPA